MEKVLGMLTKQGKDLVDLQTRKHLGKNNQSQAVEILAMMNQLKEEVAALKEANNHRNNEELKEETEEMKLKKWMDDVVKLPQYFELLKEDGFDDLESVQDLTDNDLKAMGVTKTGHRRMLLRNVAKLQIVNGISSQPVHLEHHVSAAKIDVEGPNSMDT